MFRRIPFMVLVCILLAVQLQPASFVQADPTGEFFAAPAFVMPGAQLVFSGYGFTANSTVDLYLETIPSQYLGTYPTDGSGQFTGQAVLPSVPPGDYQVMASPNDVFASVTVLPELTLDLLPNSGPPGTIVHFTLNNLSAGQLRLDYAGVPVFGPVEVSAGALDGEFLVPGDRPSPLGTDAEVVAVNLLGSQVIGTASTFFVSQEPDPAPFTITEVEMPVDPVAPGSSFPISGKIVPAPSGPMGAYSLKILWKAASGQVVPITMGTPVLLSDGSFTANARVPSLLAGDPLIPEAGGQVGIAFFNMNNGSQSIVSNVAWGIQPPDPVFVVKVVDPVGNPIPDALVDIRAFYSDFKQLGGQTTGGQVLNNQLSGLEVHENQISSYLGGLSPGESDPFTCDNTNVYGKTNQQGEFAVKFDPAMIAMMGQKIFLGNLPKPTYMEVPMEITFPLYVNGIHKGFGTQNGAEPFKMTIRFSGYTNRFYKADTNVLLNTNPLVVTLQPLPPGTAPKIPLIPKMTNVPVIGSFTNYLGTGIPMTAFGNFYSFPLAQFPESWFAPYAPNLVQIEFQHDSALFGTLDETKMTFNLAGQVYPFVYAGAKFEGQVGCNAIVYRTYIPNFHRFAPGIYTGMIKVYDTSTPAHLYQHYIQLNVVPAPTWIGSAKFKQRKIYAGNPYYFSLTASQYPPGDPSSISNLDTNVNKVGFLKNRVSNQDEVVQYLYPDKTSGIKFDGDFGATVMNEATGKSTEQAVAGGSEIVFGPTTETVLNTGKIPLYRHVFGIAPIAGATIGADMWFDAKLTYDGKVKFLSTGGTSTTLTVTPDATVGVDAFFDGEVLFGLVSAEAHAVPSIGLKMPTKFVDGTMTDSTKCFHYKLDVKWEVSAGVWPFEVSKSGTEHVFNGSNPDPCTLPSAAYAADAAYPAAVTPAPPVASPSLAVDGFGNTLMLWVANGNIQARRLAGGQAVADIQVSASSASSDPQVAFYAPNKAVAVWSESSLTPAQSQTASLSQRIQAQHLRYALWNGISWGSPTNLTLPADSSGEGKVVLASCPSTKANCPSGGEVTAVWVRNLDPTADITSRQFRLFFSTFNGASWNTPQAIDPASTAADAEATLAYLNSGVPVAAWVRDADRSLATLADRRIALRTLVGGQPVIVETSLPAQVVEPSLALNAQDEMLLAFTVATDPQALVGNQRQLHVAKQTCSAGCTWTYQALVDPGSRPVHAENPQLTINAGGQAQITYRALGFGAEYPGGPVVLKGDALGTILGTGEIAQASINFASNTIVPTYLTSAGNTVWQISAVFDSLLNQVYVVGSQGSGPVLPSQTKERLAAAGYALGTLNGAVKPIVFTPISAKPDFAIADVTANTLYPSEGGDPLEVWVTVTNDGAAFRGSLEMKLTWDAPAGVGEPAGQFTVPVDSMGPLTVLEFSTAAESLTLPPQPYLPHILYVQVNPSQALPESDYRNNLTMVALGGLPAPQGLAGAAQPNDSSVFLSWLPVEHPALAGYRVYRTSDGRSWEPVGSAFGLGFVDLSAVVGQTYEYAVTAYAGDGFESPLSNKVLAVVVANYPTYLPFVRR